MTTDFRALCAELLQLEQEQPVEYTNWKRRYNAAIARTRTALAQAEPGVPTDGEVTELVAWLRQFANAKKGYRRGTTAAALALKVTRAANLLERLASDNAGLAAAADSLYADNMSLLDSHHE